MGGAVPWLASYASLNLMDQRSGLPLLAAQTLTMPAGAVVVWVALKRLWPGNARLCAALLALSVWLMPGLYLALADGGRVGGGVTRIQAVPGLLAAGPMILSVYMLNSFGLAAALIVLGTVAVWRQRGIPAGV